MIQHVRPAVVLLVLTTLLTGIAYPLLTLGIARIVFPAQAAGSLIRQDGRVVGSALIGQNFTAPDYFHGRPSAAGKSGYDATASGGSNMGPTNKALIERVHAATETLKAEQPAALPIPADLVTASASGLDPEISPAAAVFQIPRVARARNVPEQRLQALVAEMTTQPTLGVLGEPRVNVLLLNLALDRAMPRATMPAR